MWSKQPLLQDGKNGLCLQEMEELVANHFYHSNQRNLENCRIKQGNSVLSLCFTCRNSQSLLNTLGYYESPRSQYRSRNFPNLLNHRVAGCSLCCFVFSSCRTSITQNTRSLMVLSTLKFFDFQTEWVFSSMYEKKKNGQVTESLAASFFGAVSSRERECLPFPLVP